MRTLKLTIQYDGTRFAGWQLQTNGPTVQGAIEGALKKVLGSDTKIVGAGRTDAGVHALGQVAHLKTCSSLPAEKVRDAVNSLLPEDIVIALAEEAGADFNAQFLAKTKVYRYTIVNNRTMNPLLRKYAAKVVPPLNLASMRAAARVLKGRHDFTSFRAKGLKRKSAVRRIRSIGIVRKGDLVFIEIEADGFLHHMVRNIVGTLIEVGRGKIAPCKVRRILAAKDRTAAGPTAPAKGLCLMKVKY